MRDGEGASNRQQPSEAFRRRKLLARGEQTCEGLARQELEHETHGAVLVFVQVDDFDNIGVLELGCRARLDQKTLVLISVEQVLEGDLASRTHVGRAIQHTHTTRG